jgi:hypothetical protein
MHTYKIDVSRTSTRTLTIPVTALTEWEAEEKAHEAARNLDFSQSSEGLVEYEIVNLLRTS